MSIRSPQSPQSNRSPRIPEPLCPLIRRIAVAAVVALLSVAMLIPPVGADSQRSDHEGTQLPDFATRRSNLDVGCFGNLEAGFTEVLSLDIVAGAPYTPKRGPKYSIDERDRYATTGVGRVAYCLEVGEQWILTTFDAPTPESSALGVPVKAKSWQQKRIAVDVQTNVAGIPTGNALSGAIEFWPNNYAADRQIGIPGASDAVLDADDTRRSGRYGSMQVHLAETGDQESSTLWAFNRWAQRGVKDVGIGDRPKGSTDWTSARNSASVDSPRLRVFAQASAGTVTDAGALQTGAIIPRKPSSGIGRTVVRGVAPKATSVRVSTLDGDVIRRFRQAPVKANGTFSIEVDVPARSRSHAVVLEAMTGEKPTRLLTVADVAGGDLIVIQGQSNSVARYTGTDPDSEIRESRWMRSFGSSNTLEDREAFGWNLASAKTAYDIGSVGQWGIQLGNDLLNATSVPVAIMNGAQSGEGAKFFQRNDANPLDPATNYGRLLHRLHAAGLRNSPVTFTWYQGEADWRRPSNQVDFVNPLFDAWAEDMPRLQRIYAMQIRNGCGSLGVVDGDLGVREMQRRIAVQRSEVSLVSTSALPGHDGCHFKSSGYAALGSHLATLFQRDHLGADFGVGIEGPQPFVVRFTNKSRRTVEILLTDSVDVPVLNDTTEFSSSANRRRVTKMTAKPGKIILRFNRPLPKRATLRYLGAELPVVTSSQGIGMVAFDDIRIQAAKAPVPERPAG